MSEAIRCDRRGFLGAVAMTAAAAQLGMVPSADAQFRQSRRGREDENPPIPRQRPGRGAGRPAPAHRGDEVA